MTLVDAAGAPDGKAMADIRRIRAALRALATPDKIVFLHDLGAGNGACLRLLTAQTEVTEFFRAALALPEIDRLALVARLRLGW